MTTRVPRDEHGRKRCARCLVYKAPADFPKNRSAADGLNCYCKACISVRTKQDYPRRSEYWKQPHLVERARQRVAEWREEHPEYNREYAKNNPERMREKARRWSTLNPDKKRAWDRRYRELRQTPEQKERHRARLRAYKRANPQKMLAHYHRRRARLKAGGTYTVAEWRAMCAFYDHRCLCCGVQLPIERLTVDHVIPVAHGGPNTIYNLQPLCGPCNQRKNARTIDYRTAHPPQQAELWD